MKATIVLSFIICLSDCLFAQYENPIKKGSFITGGSISIDINRQKFFDPSFSPDIASIEVKTVTVLPVLDLKYLLTDHLSLGLITEDFISYSRTKDNISGINNKDNISDFFLGPVIRYYTKSGFFLIGSAEIGGYKRTANKRKYLFSTGLGYSVFVGKSVAIESVLRYNYYYSEFTKIIDQIEKKSGLELSIGLQIIFNFKKLNTQKDEN